MFLSIYYSMVLCVFVCFGYVLLTKWPLLDIKDFSIEFNVSQYCKRIEWPLVRTVLFKCSPFTIYSDKFTYCRSLCIKAS